MANAHSYPPLLPLCPLHPGRLSPSPQRPGHNPSAHRRPNGVKHTSPIKFLMFNRQARLPGK
jgi:hypothetical protein